ncbi:MAG: SdpI family protein [Lachnospiraceae bacterium]
MFKKNKRKVIISSLIILLPILIGLLLWNRLPDQIATHWNAEGVADDYSSKLFALIGLPAFLFVIHWLCLLVTSADPKNRNLNGKPLELVLWICPVISLLVNAMIYGTALGMEINVEFFVPLVLSILFIIIGNYLPKCRQNYTIGIKVPWALNSEENWNHTHRFAGIVWVVGGFLMLFAAFTGIFALWIILTFVIAFIPMIYSYVYYVKYEEKK